jgi:hypothetical protein
MQPSEFVKAQHDWRGRYAQARVKTEDNMKKIAPPTRTNGNTTFWGAPAWASLAHMGVN